MHFAPPLFLELLGVSKNMNCYRVWMRDGYAGLYDALSEDEAKAVALAAALKATKGAAMSQAELKAALTVDRVECLYHGGTDDV